MEKYNLEILDSIDRVSPGEWNLLADQLKTPILLWEWLHALEASGSAAPAFGWFPRHFLLRKEGRLTGAAPLYLRTRSWGDFSYDYMWEDAARQLGKPFFPKLVGMSPATPSEGYRFLSAPGQDPAHIASLLLAGIDRFCEEQEIPSLNLHFTDSSWEPVLKEEGLVSWKHQVYHWQNRGFSTFEDWLSLFTKNQRRNIRREIKSMENAGVRIQILTGKDIPVKWYREFYTYYEETNDRFGPWAAKFLTPSFFQLLQGELRKHIVFVSASQEDETIAMGFLLRKGKRLIGRYWGSLKYIKDLHFNVCYYAPIRWAIEEGIEVFDPGIGSEHKIRRGFEARASNSYHRFYDPLFHRIFAENVPRVDRYVEDYINDLNRGLPFKMPVI